MTQVLTLIAVFFAAAFFWTLWEYCLHRFAFHEMKGKGIGSREHLDHHVTADWNFDPIILLAWFGVLLVGTVWGLLGGWFFSTATGIAMGTGWTFGYFFYEYHHRAAHVRAPKNRWERWVRKSHFQHHFGHPMLNQGVTISLWDHVFRTTDPVDKVKVPRRMAMRWLLDEDGNIRPEYADDYELVGTEATTSERQRQLDHARAFANLEPIG